MARDRTRIRTEPLIAFGVPVYGGALIPTVGQDWFVDPNADVFVPKKKWGVGKSDDRPFRTLAEALAVCNTLDRIFITGNIREEGLICSNLKFDVQIIGVGGQHHPDQPTSAYHPGSACIRPPASPTAVTPLISVRGRGWQFHNILFDAPVDAAAIRLVRNSSSGTSEYDAGHAIIANCDFRNGLRGIEDSDGTFNVTVKDCVFETLDATTSAAGLITVANTGVAATRRWRILNNFFQPDCSTEGNERHIVMALNGSLLKGNTFGTVKGTGLYVDLNTGVGNVVTENVMMGLYDTTDYRPGTGDVWYNNSTVVKATYSPDGQSIQVPGA
jgi:hypothetical protein